MADKKNGGLSCVGWMPARASRRENICKCLHAFYHCSVLSCHQARNLTRAELQVWRYDHFPCPDRDTACQNGGWFVCASYTHTHTHTYTHTHTHAHAHTHSRAHTTHAIHAYTYSHTHTHTHVPTRTRVMCARAHTHARTHMHTPTDMHIQNLSSYCSYGSITAASLICSAPTT